MEGADTLRVCVCVCVCIRAYASVLWEIRREQPLTDNNAAEEIVSDRNRDGICVLGVYSLYEIVPHNN